MKIIQIFGLIQVENIKVTELCYIESLLIRTIKTTI